MEGVALSPIPAIPDFFIKFLRFILG
jgi:hypothetical protein